MTTDWVYGKLFERKCSVVIVDGLSEITGTRLHYRGCVQHGYIDRIRGTYKVYFVDNAFHQLSSNPSPPSGWLK